MIPLHPEAVPDDPATVRWRYAGVDLPPGGLRRAPEPLQVLIEHEIVSGVVIETGALLVTLAAGRTWRADGARVRTALHTALESPRDWQVDPPADPAVGAVEAVLAGPAGAVVRSHGGSVRVLGVSGDAVELELNGSCAGCPASGLTIETTLAAQIRRELPAITQVRVRSAPVAPFVPLATLLRRRQ